MDAVKLEECLRQGPSQRLGFSQSTVRHWLRRHGLRTTRARRIKAHGERGVDPARKTLQCASHGTTEFQFHHRQSSEKHFGVGESGLTRSLAAVRAEAAKCILLCANCHAEVEGGLVNAA